MKKITQADIDEIRALQKTAPKGVWLEKTHHAALHNHAEALLEAAEYGMKAQEFFREMEKQSNLTEVRGTCTNCSLNEECHDNSFRSPLYLCCSVVDAAKAAGLLEGE